MSIQAVSAEALQSAFYMLYADRKMSGPLQWFARQVKAANRGHETLALEDVDPPTVKKLNAACDGVLKEFQLPRDYFMEPEFQELCSQLRGQNLVLV